MTAIANRLSKAARASKSRRIYEEIKKASKNAPQLSKVILSTSARIAIVQLIFLSSHILDIRFILCVYPPAFDHRICCNPFVAIARFM
ncbi:MAG: hypothetical protein MHMPM18_002100 [Marteilia pararefringens]